MRHFTSNGTDQCQNDSSDLLTPYREQPQSTRSEKRSLFTFNEKYFAVILGRRYGRGFEDFKYPDIPRRVRHSTKKKHKNILKTLLR